MFKFLAFIASAVIFYKSGLWLLIPLVAISTWVTSVLLNVLYRIGAERGEYQGDERQQKFAFRLHTVWYFSFLLMIGCWGYAAYLLFLMYN